MAKRYPLLGILAGVIAYSSIIIAILVSPWFSWLNNALSDLGNTSVQRNITSGSAAVFDGGPDNFWAADSCICPPAFERFQILVGVPDMGNTTDDIRDRSFYNWDFQ